ncbi:hypothetical protein B0H19DRAFT_1265799 [Mycena capillaripes]|nr:hypothetical protein B0H19DRAFT_1265799 [Mycena capillaripes]
MNNILVLLFASSLVAAVSIGRDPAVVDAMLKRLPLQPVSDLEAVNSGWTVDGNNVGWTVDGDNFGWHVTPVWYLKRSSFKGVLHVVQPSSTMKGIFLLLTFAFLVTGAPVDSLPEQTRNAEIIAERQMGPIPAVKTIPSLSDSVTKSLVDSQNTGWTVDGNNNGWTVDGNNDHWTIKGTAIATAV